MHEISPQSDPSIVDEENVSVEGDELDEHGYFTEYLGPRISHRSEEAVTPDIFLDRIAEYQPYDEAVIAELLAEGYTELQAIAIAATTIDGAGEKAGGISSRQTACAYLRYSESIAESEGQLEGREAMQSKVIGYLRNLFSIPDDVELTEEKIDELIDAAIIADTYRAEKNNDASAVEFSKRDLEEKKQSLSEDLAFLENIIAELEQDEIDYEAVLEVLAIYKHLVRAEEYESMILSMRDGQASYLDVANGALNVLVVEFSNTEQKLEKM